MKRLVIVAAAMGGIVLATGGSLAAGKISLADDIVCQWLDDTGNQRAFIAWANENLTGEQVLSLELLMSPPPSDADKRDALDKAARVLEAAGLRTGAAIEALQSERAKLPDPIVVTVEDDAPRRRP